MAMNKKESIDKENDIEFSSGKNENTKDVLENETNFQNGGDDDTKENCIPDDVEDISNEANRNINCNNVEDISDVVNGWESLNSSNASNYFVPEIETEHKKIRLDDSLMEFRKQYMDACESTSDIVPKHHNTIDKYEYDLEDGMENNFRYHKTQNKEVFRNPIKFDLSMLSISDNCKIENEKDDEQKSQMEYMSTPLNNDNMLEIVFDESPVDNDILKMDEDNKSEEFTRRRSFHTTYSILEDIEEEESEGFVSKDSAIQSEKVDNIPVNKNKRNMFVLYEDPSDDDDEVGQFFSTKPVKGLKIRKENMADDYNSREELENNEAKQKYNDTISEEIAIATIGKLLQRNATIKDEEEKHVEFKSEDELDAEEFNYLDDNQEDEKKQVYIH